MDFDITQFATPGFVVFCLAVYAVSFSVRRIVEGIFKKYSLADKYFWREVVVVVLPVVVGLLIGAFMKFFPYPDGFTGRGSHMLYGLFCGLSSSLVYRVAKSLVRKAWPGALPQKSGDDSSTPSDPGSADGGSGL